MRILHVDASFVSPWALGAFVGLEEKGLPYELKTLPLGQQLTSAPSYKGRNHKVPALQEGDWWLTESMAIVEYLAETYPAPQHPRLFPEDLKERALCREVQSFLRSDFMALRKERPTTTLWGARATLPLSDEAKKAGETLVAYASSVVRGESIASSWCIGDVDLTVALMRLVANGHAVPPALARYAETNWNRPSVAKWHRLNAAAPK
jgi:glutathione S-transferase